MLEPDSRLLVLVLLLAAAGGLVLVVRLRRVPLRAGAAVLVIAAAALSGMAAVNDYYGYYQTWSQLSADLSGSYPSYGTEPSGFRRYAPTGRGEVRAIRLGGPRSGISRSGLIYLPPQYFAPRFAHTSFPVIELLHGSPGRPSDWVIHLRVDQLMNRLIARHLIGPTILVMPAMNAGHDYQECVDAPGAADDTYITQDVRADVLARFRASPVAAEWGVAGYSSGGYCAANLALRHRAWFGAAGVLDGYFRPTDGQAAAALHYDPAAERANDPLLAARALNADVAPLPAFWVAAGSGDAADLAAANAFTSALHGIERVTLYRQPGARHNFYAWAAGLPRMLQWAWSELAPPQLRVEFPISGPVTRTVIVTPGAGSPPAVHSCGRRCGNSAARSIRGGAGRTAVSNSGRRSHSRRAQYPAQRRR